MIAAFYAAVLALLFIVLSIYVIKARQTYKMLIGHDDSGPIERRSRAHANFAEYTPLFLVLLFALEYNALPGFVVHAIGFVFTVGRASHAYGMSMAETTDPKTLKYRIFGMKCTFITLVSAATILLVQVTPKLISGN